MIEKLNVNEKQDLISFLKNDPVMNIYGLSYAEGYPFDDRFYKAYRCDNGYLLIVDSIGFLYSDYISEEIYSFLNIIGVKFLYSLVKPIYNSDKADVLFVSTLLDAQDTLITKSANDKEVYDLLVNAFDVMPDFECYRNTRTEQRHYLGSFCENIVLNDQVVSTATVGMQNSLSGLISCVATRMDMQNRGFASAVIAHTANKLVNINKQAVIIANEEKVIKLYKKLGFELAGKMYITSFV